MAFLLARSDLVAAQGCALAEALRAQHGVRAVARLVPDFVVPSAGCALVLLRAPGDGGGGGNRGAREALALLRGFKVGVVVVLGDRIADPDTHMAPWPDAVQVVALPEDAHQVFAFLVRIAQRVHSSKLRAAQAWVEDERKSLLAGLEDARMQAVLEALPIDRGEAHALMDVCGSVDVLATMSAAAITEMTPLSAEAADRITAFFAHDHPVLR